MTRLAMREVDLLRVKGKPRPMAVYEVLDNPPEPSWDGADLCA